MSTTAKFPADFHWGYATASAQVEGSVSIEVDLVWTCSTDSRSVCRLTSTEKARASGTPFQRIPLTVKMEATLRQPPRLTRSGSKTLL